MKNAWLVAFLAGCHTFSASDTDLGIGDTDTNDTEDPPDTDVPCDNTATLTTPEANATDVDPMTTIEIEFDTRDMGVAVQVDGGDVTGALEWRNNTLVFTPDVALTAGSTHRVEVTFDCGVESWSFSTSEADQAVDPGTLVGNTYVLELMEGNFVRPAGVGALLSQYVTRDLLVGVAGATDESLALVSAVSLDGSEPPEQDTCEASVALPPAAFQGNPYFQVPPQDLSIEASGYTLTVQKLKLSGTFAPDGSSIEGASVAGSIDTRPLVPLVDPEGADDAVCQLVASLGIECVDCPDGSGTYCLDLLVDDIPAPLTDGTLIEQTQDEACDRAECSTNAACVQ